MQSAKPTIYSFSILLLLTFFTTNTATAQENSPYSRYGIGDLFPNHNMQTRAMGGISAAIADFQGLNSTNPASYSNIVNSIFDVGLELDSRTLKSTNNTSNFTSTNPIFSYTQLGFPIKMKKANKKNIFAGIAMGIKPVSRINYKIARFERLQGIDSVVTFYEGSGGLNQLFIGGALRIKNFSFGANFGYHFGNRDYSTKRTFLNDTVFYHESNSSTTSNFDGLVTNLGLQYDVKVKKGYFRVGAYGGFKQKLNASNELVRETIFYNAYDEPKRLDSVFVSSGSGEVLLPTNWGIGFLIQQPNWSVGIDFEKTQWTQYRFFGEKDAVKDNWTVRAGAEYFPANEKTPMNKYFNFVKYRMGFFYGPDYVNLGSNLPQYGITLGAGFPLKLRKSYYETQTSVLNTAIEIGGRGSKSNSIKENIFRICFGLQLSDLWFRRAKYD